MNPLSGAVFKENVMETVKKDIDINKCLSIITILSEIIVKIDICVKNIDHISTECNRQNLFWIKRQLSDAIQLLQGECDGPNIDNY